MADIIQLLPDAIANQIAAGEVIQRPASVVKELMENSIDAGSTDIKLVVKEAGKTLIQVIDNGCGMTETDARMSFERHATSKIRQAKDLFAIRTMGFRGEALASIAAIAHVEMRTRRQSDELGTLIQMEGSEVKSQEACQCSGGTALSVKNLFFNVPARRNFLKSNSLEMRYIIDEFQRIAIANPDIFFSLHHNGSEVFHLPPGNLRQRLTGIFGANSNKKLVPVAEETDILKLTGFVGKPEFAKKTRGEQYFYVNNRFIKSSYLNHAVVSAYENLLPADTYPLYVIFMETDPARIDINVHPTKQEIKFEDERLVYNYLKVAVRHSLGQYSIMPSLDFDIDTNFANATRIKPRPRRDETVRSASSPPSSSARPAGNSEPAGDDARRANNLRNWQELYEGLDAFDSEGPAEKPGAPGPKPLTLESNWHQDQPGSEESKITGTERQQRKEPYQVHNTYIASQIKSGLVLIDQQSAHERILYERFLDVLKQQKASTQNQLFPRTLTLSPNDAALLKDILEQVNLLGFDIQEFGVNTFVINGLPAEMAGKQDEVEVIESLLEQYKGELDVKLDTREQIARAMARSAAIKRGQPLSAGEMQMLIDQLFACQAPFKSPSGRNCFITFELDELAKRFEG
ncbi:MAG: DNA mismatch repair endonuclease MutL [Phaeodactylibacter sp.]|nr:DNA mismatch repair endonuclease MutL [Phaeodactylibacter sp.]MCB9293246.1 DNA mismatch repair endonuclease MutL [Lewinellaceae bacterium]